MTTDEIIVTTIADTAEEILDKEELDGIMVGTRCDLHTDIAIYFKVRKRSI